MTTRMGIQAAHPNGLHIQRDENILSAMTVSGPAGCERRGVAVRMTDADIRGVLAKLALDPRWSAALDVLAAAGFPMGPQAPDADRERYRRHLCERMAEAMASTDRAQS
jgi:hypothetical protein